MITGKAGHDYRATGGAVEALNPGAKGGVKAAQESSSHNHGGSITDDFVSDDDFRAARAECIRVAVLREDRRADGTGQRYEGIDADHPRSRCQVW